MKRFFYVLMDKAGDDKGGGGGEGDKPDPSKEAETLKAQNAELMKQIEQLKAGNKPDPKPDDDLGEKARKERQATDKKNNDSKSLEAALKFNLSAKEFLKSNGSLLPKDIEDIFAVAEKEKYDSAIEKHNAILSAMVQSFFKEQSNMDLLTAAQKNHVEDYLKLTKAGKEEKAQHMFDSVFEPALELKRRVKKAEALEKGHGLPSDTQNAYKDKLVSGSRKHWLGETKNES
jgi:hypothetical protein